MQDAMGIQAEIIATVILDEYIIPSVSKINSSTGSKSAARNKNKMCFFLKFTFMILKAIIKRSTTEERRNLIDKTSKTPTVLSKFAVNKIELPYIIFFKITRK